MAWNIGAAQNDGWDIGAASTEGSAPPIPGANGNSVLVGGTWRQMSPRVVRVGGVWRDVLNGFTSVNGAWTPFYLGVPPTQNYADAVIARNPLSYWRLGEASGSVATDEMGISNGTYISFTNYRDSSPPEINDGNLFPLFVPASVTRVSTPHSAAYSVPAEGALVIECWFKLNSINRLFTIYAKWGSGSALDDVLVFQIQLNNRPQVIVEDSTTTIKITASATLPVTTGVWYYSVLVYNNKTLSLYINNTLWATASNASFSGTILNYNIPLYLGYLDGSGASRTIDGHIGEVAIYDYDWYTGLTNKDWYNYL